MITNKLQVKGVLFDLDGTIVDSRPAYQEAARLTFDKFGLISIKDSYAVDIPRRLEKNLPLYFDGKKCPSNFLKVYLDNYYSISEHKTKLISNVSKTLNILSNTMKLAIVTIRSIPTDSIIRELKRFEIESYFDVIITALPPLKPKPSPEALLKCVDILNVHETDCIIVGDSINDIRAGKLAGIKTIAVLSGLFSFQELFKENPNLILPNVNYLPNFIK